MNLNAVQLLESAVHSGASDIFIIAGSAISLKINGSIRRGEGPSLLPDDTKNVIQQIYDLAGNRSMDRLLANGDDDFSFALPGVSRFRANAYKQRGSLSIVIRIITFSLPNPKELGIPDRVINLANCSKGLILVTGPAGSGKSTTLACMIDHINQNSQKHIITLEDPVEYLHRHGKSIVSQREINIDSNTYISALRAALRQSPDVILLGELRDYETMQVAMTAAETGHLVLSTLHTVGAANTIDRIMDVFPSAQQHQVVVQLSMVLKTVVSQLLIPDIEGNMIPSFEIMTVTPAVRNMIRDKKIPQLEGFVYSANNEDMISQDSSLLQMYKNNIITRETALTYAYNPEMLQKRLS